MPQRLPADGFKWIDTSLIDKKISKFTVMIKKVIRNTYLK